MTTRVRATKYRHIFGTQFQLRDCYGDIRLGSCSPDSNPLIANSQYFALPWCIPGSVCVVPLERKGTVPEETPLIRCEDDEPAVNDLRFHPFQDIIATAHQNGSAKLWRIPPGGLTQNINEPEQTLSGHTKRLLFVDFHPLSDNVLLTSGADYEIKLWDISQGHTFVTLPAHKGIVTSVSWNYNGSVCLTTAKDKQLRTFDARSGNLIAQAPDHQGTKSRGLWLGRTDFICSIGLSRTNDREIAIFDPRNLSTRLVTHKIDQTSSMPLPFWDDDRNLLYVASKGDSSIRYFEIVNEAPIVHLLGEFKSREPTTGIAIAPKHELNVMKCEIFRALKLSLAQIIPIRFEVPRQNLDFFQDDLFPNTSDGRPTMTTSEWLSGANNTPNLVPVRPN
eukprot:TRINITY_DN392_c1_g1_i1.p1 TRINITY_DN392_c1_g1~~TRINITY_DN392_c1_g1_i1.p1  ORF type:complete len:392 (+),score=188.84 TRINITY_DN392_c1_g1_i1:104-1279(+)